MTQTSTLKPFVAGDIFVGATLLNVADDDHAGDGRIIQYDADLNEKGILWTGKGHLIGGLRFAPDGVLWAFDSQEFRIIKVAPSGEMMPAPSFDQRAFSNVNFARNGDIYLAEHMVGDAIAVELGTHISKMPGSDRYGDGHIFRYGTDGSVQEYHTETHGGMAGFLGVTMSALSADERTMVYATETGPRLMRYDLVDDRQLPDLVSYPEGQREMFFGMAFDSAGALLVARGNRIDVLDSQGNVSATYPLEGFGWAMVANGGDDQHFLTTNFFSGDVAKVDRASGEVLAQINVGVARSVAGVAEYPG
jgi:sugar lactone lactonase YvrE